MIDSTAHHVNPEAINAAHNILSSIHFPQYSQIDPRWEFEPGSERSMCGIVCIKAMIDFYSPDGQTPTVHELITVVNDSSDQKPNGISHAVEVNLLKSQGLLAWRRNWEAPTADPAWLVENEEYDSEQVEAIKHQLEDESLSRDINEAGLIAIRNSLADRNPVIASVRAHFGGNQADHQVVITEMSKDGQSIVIMDPEKQPGFELRTEATDRFLEYFNHKAIFCRQA